MLNVVLYCRFILTKHIQHNYKLKCKHIEWSQQSDRYKLIKQPDVNNKLYISMGMDQ